MTNYERWNLMLKNVTSPQSFVDFGFYFLISACLQRRVWVGGHNPNIKGQLYPNIFVALVGPPGVGKGRVISQVNSMLTHWSIDLQSGSVFHDENGVFEDTGREIIPLFTAGPEDVTYEALLRKQARSIRYTDWSKSTPGREKHIDTPMKYGSSPVYFSLEELSSLFDKDSKRVAKYLLNAYDCEDYTRETITRGQDVIKKPCLTFLAGTTPTFLEENMDSELLSDGLTARFWFIYEMVERFRRWDITPMDDAQREARKHLLEHIKSLASVYGRVTFSEEAEAFLKEWWEHTLPTNKVNNNPRLVPYYTRKNIHVRKLAMIKHFAETSASYEIPLSIAQEALEALDLVEKKMHYALSFKGRNPLGAISAKILTWMHEIKIPVTATQILAPEGGGFYNELNVLEVGEVMRYLQSTGKVLAGSNGFYSLTTPPADSNKLAGIVSRALATKRKEPTIGADLPALPLAPDVKPPV